ncbi:MAG: MBOAT family O-acyltransferase [Flavobacteriaceae bacterium]
MSTIIDFTIGINIPKCNSHKKARLLLWTSISLNLIILGFFKYYNFFIDSWINLLELLGYRIKNLWTLKIVLPVGISFYTFQTMSYTIDIYKKKLKPTNDFISFATFVSFFPQLVAGPIERATNLLPQVLKCRNFKFQKGIEGLRLIAWGLFKKVVIADSLAPIVNNIFGNYDQFHGGTLCLGAIYFAFQIYCDFSGYSDIAIGTSKLFGFELMSNFRSPYFSRNVGEFWRKWHISLSSWFRDYLYIPLGGSRQGNLTSIMNIFIIFIISGLWHGANWTFILWGLFHSILFIPLFIYKVNRKYINSVVGEKWGMPSISEIFKVSITFSLVTVGWVFFRSETITDSFNYLKIMFFDFSPIFLYKKGMLYVVTLLIFDYLFREKERLDFSFFGNIEIILLSVIIFFVIWFHNQSSEFIYFQF